MKKRSSWPSMRRKSDSIMRESESLKIKKRCDRRKRILRRWNKISMNKSMKRPKISISRSIVLTVRYVTWILRSKLSSNSLQLSVRQEKP